MEVFMETLLSFIRKPDFRRRTIFLYGKPKSGKTRVLTGLEEIFSMVKVYHSESKWCNIVRSPLYKDKEIKQWVAFDEGSINSLFSLPNMSNMKEVMGGQGL